jgi:hypothetical protein
MQEKQIIGEDGKIITIRVVMSGEYFLPHNSAARLTIAQKRLSLIAPEVNNVKFKKSYLKDFGIKYCINCKYPQPLENTYCCLCLEYIKTY